MKYKLLITALFCAVSCFSQSPIRQFRALSGPVKSWTVLHPVAALRARPVSARALALTDSMRADGRLGTDYNGGQLDAFRHGVWMAMLSQKMRYSKAHRLGLAYEKGNYRLFLSGKLEDGALQDSVAGEMDLYNNRVGLCLGDRRRPLSEHAIIARVVSAVQEGEFLIIRKDEAGNALDRHGEVISLAEWRGKWTNARCLWRSNFTEGI